MKVKELIEKLSEMGAEDEVYFSSQSDPGVNLGYFLVQRLEEYTHLGNDCISKPDQIKKGDQEYYTKKCAVLFSLPK